MGSAGDDQVVDSRTHPDASSPADGIPSLRRRESMAERLERLRVEREREELERRARIERERAEREAAYRDRLERRSRQRAERLRRERQVLRRPARRPRPAKPETAPRRRVATPKAAHAPTAAQVRPGVHGPVRKRARAAENRRRAAMRRRGLALPTAKAGRAVTVVLGLSAALGSALGLPVPGLDAGGHGSLVNSASLFGVDHGTPQGLPAGYVF